MRIKVVIYLNNNIDHETEILINQNSRARSFPDRNSLKNCSSSLIVVSLVVSDSVNSGFSGEARGSIWIWTEDLSESSGGSGVTSSA